MPGIYKTMDVAFRFASRFEQCLYRGALVNVFSQQSPPFLLVLPDWVVRKLWSVDQGVEIGTCVRCVQSGLSEQLCLCRGYHAHT